MDMDMDMDTEMDDTTSIYNKYINVHIYSENDILCCP